MTSPHPFNYLRTCRKRSALSQEEVACLIGAERGDQVCRHERFTREPGLHTALAYEAIYQKPISELFPDLFAQVRMDVKARAMKIEQTSAQSIPSPLLTRKRQALAVLASFDLTQS